MVYYLRSCSLFIKLYKRSVSLFCFFFLITASYCFAQEGSLKTNNKKDANKKDITANFFIAPSIQTFIPVAQLKDYTSPKPGWRASFGYTFFHQKKHSLPLYFEAGHSVVLGVNPLVRTFDIFPIMIGLGYEWQPFPLLTIGANVSCGMFISNIKHYSTALNLLQDKITTTKDVGGVVSAGVSVGTNLIENNLELRATLLLETILEKPRVIPLPSFQLALRLYPKGIYNYALKKQEVKIVEKIIVKEVEKDRIEREEPTQYETIYVYFLPESAELDINAISQVKKAATRLQEHQELYILFEGSTAQFGSVMGRERLEAERVGKVVEYLQKNCGIEKSRILYTPKIKEGADSTYEKRADVNYTQYRWVRMRFIRIYFNSNSGEKNVYEE